MASLSPVGSPVSSPSNSYTSSVSSPTVSSLEEVNSLVSEFKHLSRTTRNFTGSDEAYYSALRRAKSQVEALTSTQRELESLSAASAHHAEKLHAHNSRRVRRVLCPRKERSKVELYEEHLTEARQSARKAQEKLMVLKNELRKAEMEQVALEAQAGALKAAEGRKRAIIGELFEEGALLVPQERETKEAVERIERTLQKAIDTREREKTAMKALKGAKLDLENALLLLKTTASGERVGEYIIDRDSRINLGNATKLAKIAHKNMVSAAECNPFLPLAKEARAQGGFADVSNIGLPVSQDGGYQKRDVLDAIRGTLNTLSVVKESFESQVVVLRNAHADVLRLEKELNATSEYLKLLREAILKQLDDAESRQ